MKFYLSDDELLELADGHADRAIEAMGIDEIKSCAKQMMASSYFDSSGNRECYTQASLLSDMLVQEGGDKDSLYEFMVGAGISEDRAQKAIDSM